GREEYNNDKDFDGPWGIYDKPFLQYTASQLNRYNEPFAAVIFTLSSHHPYSLPTDYTITEPNENTPFENTVTYVDNALKDFFSVVSNYDWFDNTIFVITADHVNPEHKFDEFKNIYGSYRVPIAFYAPQIIENKHVNEIAQHIDIGLSVLSLLNINDTIFSFGRNLFNSEQEETFIGFSNNIYHFYDGKFFMQSDGNNIKAIYDLRSNNFSKNLYEGNSKEWETTDTKFKAILQQYNNRMINNQLYYKE
ncbi:MAG: sulfatase-like hydrolase/transferase, partial [Clostridia bacterium]|nr:sulfatase-like hydrolase/transferase [Clostridia bacterium]